MNGAESLVRTLVGAGVDVCFANPGTSEMHFVAALDRVEGMRCVLGLFEGVVTGAADGYSRMADKPASTLLHLGPGLANGLANLHNAKKARLHADRQHRRRARAPITSAYDAPLTSDIEGWRGRSRTGCGPRRAPTRWPPTAPPRSPPRATPPGQIATLILPADSPGARRRRRGRTPPALAAPRARRRRTRSAAAAAILRSGEPADAAHDRPGVARARSRATPARIAAETGARFWRRPRTRASSAAPGGSRSTACPTSSTRR